MLAAVLHLSNISFDGIDHDQGEVASVQDRLVRFFLVFFFFQYFCSFSFFFIIFVRFFFFQSENILFTLSCFLSCIFCAASDAINRDLKIINSCLFVE